MATRQLSTLEVFDFYDRHPDIEAKVHAFEQMVINAGVENWSDVYVSSLENGYSQELLDYFKSFFVAPLPIPFSGIAADDPVYGPVIIFPGDDGVAYFNATDNAQLVRAVNKPRYRSSPDYLELFEQLAAQAAENIPKVGSSITTIALLVLAGIVIAKVA